MLEPFRNSAPHSSAKSAGRKSRGRVVEYTDVVVLGSPLVVAARGGSVARKMPAATPALLFSLRVAQLCAVMPQLF